MSESHDTMGSPPLSSPAVCSPVRGSPNYQPIGSSLGKRPADDQGYRDSVPADVYPWERQKGESAKAYQAFAIYRDLGPSRSKVAALRLLRGDKGKKNTGILGRWAYDFRWDERVAEWDADQERKRLTVIDKERKEMIERHSLIAQTMLDLVATKLATLDPAKITVQDLTRWVEVATKLERICKGEPSEENNRTMGNIVNIIWQGNPPEWAKQLPGVRQVEPDS